MPKYEVEFTGTITVEVIAKNVGEALHVAHNRVEMRDFEPCSISSIFDDEKLPTRLVFCRSDGLESDVTLIEQETA